MTDAGSGTQDGRPAATGVARIAGWCLYDWANSAFPTVITTFVFAAYFTKGVAASETEGTYLWGNATAIAAVWIAVLSPVLGAIADRTGRRRPWLVGFTMICIVATAALWTVRPDPADVPRALALVVVATLAFEFAGVFYNAQLPAVAPPDRMGRISGIGWGVGYAGGLACLVTALFALVQADPPPFGLDPAAAEPVRATVLLVAVWFAVFALPAFLLVPDAEARSGESMRKAVAGGLRQLAATLRGLDARSPVARFLVARMLYADGLTTLFTFGGIYAAGTFGMDFSEIIVFGIALNLTAGAGAVAFGWIDDRVGPKRTIQAALAGLMLFGALALVAPDKSWFWVAGMAMGTFMGPVQAASRTLMARLAPADRRAETFGLFALSGKATNFAGPLVLGWATLAFDSQRAGMATILVFLAAGLLLLRTVREPAAADD
ncbi:MFS transporter [Thalassobaculum fulvum]|uniref:MFS transporter n=1 Tax=Thalassobaculum fulvum TaxID=1633335 RepID=A0A918XNB6_9PROT|nr:MFS transporter [Thalassobaculum fulvum]GHD39498.1 MFS transporter [Thalassobaculum fulvum]